MEGREEEYVRVGEAKWGYVAPARYDDEIVVETAITRLKTRIVEFSYKIKTGSTLLAEGRTLHVVIGADGKPRTMPDRYFNLLKAK